MWVSADSWTKIAVALNRIDTTRIRRSEERQKLADGRSMDPDDYRKGARRARQVVVEGIGALDEELAALRRAMTEAESSEDRPPE